MILRSADASANSTGRDSEHFARLLIAHPDPLDKHQRFALTPGKLRESTTQRVAVIDRIEAGAIAPRVKRPETAGL